MTVKNFLFLVGVSVTSALIVQRINAHDKIKKRNEAGGIVE